MISVIVPVYNVEAYLERCVESIVGQTYRDLEIILVDDGSKDHSSQICDEWAKKDGRIKVILKENGGAATARNRGIEAASGEFIVFIDSDDWIEPSMFEILLSAIQEEKADVVECLLDRFKDGEQPCRYDGAPISRIHFDPEGALEELIRERKLHQTPVNKLYRTELVKGIPFQEGCICEDEYWTYQVFGQAKSIVFLDVVLYHYYQSAGSVMRSSYSLKRLACIDAYQRRLEYVTEHFPRLVPLANRAYLGACIFHYQMLCWYSDVDASGEERRQLHHRFCKGAWQGLIHHASWKYKLWYGMFRYLPSVTARLRNAFKIGW